MEATDPRAMLDDLVSRSGESYAALSRMLRRNDAYLQQYVKRGSPRVLAERDRKLLAAYFRIDEAALGGPAGSGAAAIPVRRLDIVASAGPGGLNEDERDSGGAPLDARFLAAIGVRSTNLAMIRAQGDSMAPLVADGDQIMVDEADRRIGTRGGVYVIRLDGVLMVKRVAQRAGRLAITSDNPEYPAMPPRDAAEVDVVGRVVWLSRTLK